MNDTKILFLDVDGVFTSMRNGWFNWDVMAVNFVRWACRESGYKIVISSTWRGNHGKKFFESIFGDILHEDWKTPYPKNMGEPGRRRGIEIATWLSEHTGISDYIIVDDDSDMTEQQKKHHFIQTDSINGMLAEHKKSIKDRMGIKTFPRWDIETIYIHENMFEGKI